MRRLLGTICAAWVGVAGLPVAAEQAVVVELFTSQGCSSCPPADELLSELATRGDVIALALHVDYWDYIGWADSLARPEHTERQKAYAQAAGKRMVYTPQFLVGGIDRVTGHDPMLLAELLEKHRAAPRNVVLTAEREGEVIRIEARATGPVGGPVVVQVARFIPVQRVAITRGENAGRTIDYHNAVDLWVEVGRWTGQGTYSGTARVAGDNPVAVILQREGYGPVVAASLVD
jgi:hypothetical protein